MEVKELKENTKVNDLILEITELGEPRETGNNVQILEGKGKDNKGEEVKIVFWREEVEGKEVGQKYLIKDGWCKSHLGNIQCSAGKFGKWIEV